MKCCFLWVSTSCNWDRNGYKPLVMSKQLLEIAIHSELSEKKLCFSIVMHISVYPRVVCIVGQKYRLTINSLSFHGRPGRFQISSSARDRPFFARGGLQWLDGFVMICHIDRAEIIGFIHLYLMIVGFTETASSFTWLIDGKSQENHGKTTGKWRFNIW